MEMINKLGLEGHHFFTASIYAMFKWAGADFTVGFSGSLPPPIKLFLKYWFIPNFWYGQLAHAFSIWILVCLRGKESIIVARHVFMFFLSPGKAHLFALHN